MGEGEFTGGIFMASTVNDSCHVYNALVPTELVGAGGDVEHLRPTLNEMLPEAAIPRARVEHGAQGRNMPRGPAHMLDMFEADARVKGPISLQANELFWMTDRTPHESLPLK